MLEKVDLTKSLSKEEYRAKMPLLEARLGLLQRQCKELKIPVMIVFEGFGASGKGVQIGRLIQSMDPRGFQVYPIKNETEEERMHPFLWRFWTKTPERGRISIFDGSWYRKVLIDRFEKRTKEKDIGRVFHSINSFEEQLAVDGNVIIKLFLDIDKKEQKKRFEKLKKNKETAWRVTQGDLERNAKFDEYSAMMEDMLFKTDTDYAPWTIIESTDRRFATVKIYTTVIKALADAIEEVQAAAEQKKAEKEVEERDNAVLSGTEKIAEIAQEADHDMKELQVSILSKADLSLKYTREEYKEKLDKLQKKIEKLHGELYRRRIPVVLGFEGWDAGGKGGAIKRLTEKMDARGYVVNPTASPNDIEKAHHYLWRFWRAMPKDGHVAIFDRTWYGRVMVERIEGFCTKEEWQRAYKEINDMEKDLYDSGAIVIKFWMHIDKDEQERRFREREQNPEKQWKITDEDWRNRAKWDQYEDAVNEMLLRTSTDYAPWVVVEGNDKYYARVKVLRTVVDAIEKRLKEKEKQP
ncbi:polyphosphate:AMP phosphotransferase [Lachnoclostridium sp. An169]|uniref:polyphosphate:AMP phosphotransferase n=1 Tax=Lachnoclostridium sp. An169 TaxID=1965569 RepID=UPI000B382F37|nr:polyphosphate:AMP phosphotransferase [Lachnoclostridium sp. An169]OUP85481.1 polyphosphate:AMP phosphotransferase [Lachnoclostridium sp. An169]HJA65796.1 polyphosphate:AMP phosphotransferase [Candidatus Mediterraneibacter cottocaccae]